MKKETNKWISSRGEDYPTNAKFPISNISIESLMSKSITIDLPIGTKFKQIRFAK